MISLLLLPLAHPLRGVGHIFHFLNQLIERGYDPVFHATHFLAGMAEIEPARHIVHPPRNVIERIVFQFVQIVLHQLGQLLVPSRNGFLPLQQHGDDFSPSVLWSIQ